MVRETTNSKVYVEFDEILWHYFTVIAFVSRTRVGEQRANRLRSNSKLKEAISASFLTFKIQFSYSK